LIEPEARCSAPGELGERRGGREAQGVFGGSGERFFASFLVATRKDVAFGCENPIKNKAAVGGITRLMQGSPRELGKITL